MAGWTGGSRRTRRRIVIRVLVHGLHDGAVEEVERLGAELERIALVNGELPGETKVHVAVVRQFVTIARLPGDAATQVGEAGADVGAAQTTFERQVAGRTGRRDDETLGSGALNLTAV